MKVCRISTLLLSAGAVVLLFLATTYAQQSIPVRVHRGLEVRSLVGQVTRLHPNGSTSPARIGDFLKAVGDGIETKKASRAVLLVDIVVGTVDVSENTRLVVQELAIAPDNGRITRLYIPYGQARLKVRPFTNRGSQLEIRTPTGVSGVRGTEFGVAIQPNGKTGLAVLAGQVANAARGSSVTVKGGFQNFTLPGEPPSQPVPLRDDSQLRYSFRQIIQGGLRKVQLLGQVDPVNAVLVDGKPQTTDREGRFKAEPQLFPPPMIQVIVQTPLGKEQRYNLFYGQTTRDGSITR